MLVVTERCVLSLTDLYAGTSLRPPFFRGGEHQGGGHVQRSLACTPSAAPGIVEGRTARVGGRKWRRRSRSRSTGRSGPTTLNPRSFSSSSSATRLGSPAHTSAATPVSAAPAP